MRLLFDENLSIRICPRLIDAGHDAVHVLEVGLGSADDGAIVAYARGHDQIIVSCDDDFVRLLFASGEVGPSLILTRDVDTLTSGEIAELLIGAMSAELEKLLLAGAVASLRRDRIRVRPLPLPRA